MGKRHFLVLIDIMKRVLKNAAHTIIARVTRSRILCISAFERARGIRLLSRNPERPIKFVWPRALSANVH